jgi:uncharacterized protein YjbI with pentapeptide repeats
MRAGNSSGRHGDVTSLAPGREHDPTARNGASTNVLLADVDSCHPRAMVGGTDAGPRDDDEHARPGHGEPESLWAGRRLLWTLSAAAAAVVVLFVLWAGPWLFTRAPDHGLDAEQELKAKNDVRAALVQTVGGLAVAGGLVVTYRTFRQNQRDQARRWDDQARTFSQNKRDQEKRWESQQQTYELSLAAQVTDTYTKAVEHLGHAQAPVRLGALHSLVRLAQDYPPRRQMVVDVLCAYLRLPPAQLAPDKSAAEATTSSGWLAQELQVRETTQRLLADHLRRPPGSSGDDAGGLPASQAEPFWPGMNIDLTGATLVGTLNLTEVSVVDATFSGATFPGDATFDGGIFAGAARFTGATFLGFARFDAAVFSGEARFTGAKVSRYARFHGAKFSGDAWFTGATLSGYAGFHAATFAGYAGFHDAMFAGRTSFALAEFRQDAEFGGSTFSEHARFDGASFFGDARFTAATFCAGTRFDGTTISAGAQFDAASFAGDARMGGVRIMRLDDAALNRSGDDGRRVWPTGWIVRPDAEDARRGTLVSRSREPMDPVLPRPD